MIDAIAQIDDVLKLYQNYKTQHSKQGQIREHIPSPDSTELRSRMISVVDRLTPHDSEYRKLIRSETNGSFGFRVESAKSQAKRANPVKSSKMRWNK